jgi:uncharacterized protein (DUF433 family)/DNA-binding transcriptional MerR regulator
MRPVAQPPRAIGHYSAAEVGRLAGVSARRIGQWARYGIIPSVSARPRIYSYADAGEAVLVRYLIDVRFKPREVRKIVADLRETFGAWPLATAPLEHDGKFLVIKEGDEVYISVELPGHGVIAGTLIDLHAVRAALRMGGWVAYKTESEFIEVDPERLSGRPTIKGRRIATETVADLASRPDGRVVLTEDFGLSDEEINDAVAYEKAVKEAVAV